MTLEEAFEKWLLTYVEELGREPPPQVVFNWVRDWYEGKKR